VEPVEQVVRTVLQPLAVAELDRGDGEVLNSQQLRHSSILSIR
jgi:hypothetical protein